MVVEILYMKESPKVRGGNGERSLGEVASREIRKSLEGFERCVFRVLCVVVVVVSTIV